MEGGKKKLAFQPISRIISETIQYVTLVTMEYE